MDDRPERLLSLIGRAREVAELSRLIDAACASHPALVLVEGPPGIGKTALVDHVLRNHPAGLRVLQAIAVPWETSLSFGIAAQLARGCAVELRVPEPSSVTDVARQLHALLVSSQQSQPVAVVVDDAHWADVTSLQAVSSAVLRMSAERALVVLVARDDPYDPCEAPQVRRRLPDEALHTREFLDGYQDGAVRPAALGPVEVKALASQLGIMIDLPTARQLSRHTLGSPRFAASLLRELPVETWQEWQPSLPATSRCTAAVYGRLARCGEEARALVEACAVLGQDAPLTEAATLARIEDPLPAADAARAAGLLTATSEPGRAQLSFTHPMVRAAVLTELGLVRRTELHRGAAALGGDRGRRLAHRVAASISTDTALADELDQYASERASAGEWGTVAEILVRASRLSPSPSDRQQRLLRAVDAMIGAGDVPQAAVFAAELESFPPSTLRDVVLGYLAIMRGRRSEAEAFLTQSTEGCDPDCRPDLMARICQRQVLHALGRWDAPALVAWARRAVDLAEPDDPSAVESEAVLGLGLAAMGRADEAVAAYRESVAHLAGGAQPQRFQLGWGWVDLAHDKPEAARRRLEAAVPTGYRMGSTRISLWAQGWLARTQFVMGAWQDALETVDRAAARLAESRIELVRPLVHWTGAQIHALRGEWDTAEQHSNNAAADLRHYEVMLVPACLARAQIAEARGDYARVIEALAPVVHLPGRDSIDEPGFWPWQDVYANALVMTGKLDEADDFLTPHEALAVRRGHHSTLARLGLARGRLTAARGDIDTARKEFEQALTRLEQLPLPYDRARVNFAYGQTLRRAGKRRDADTVLRNARDTYLTLGARAYVERCDRELKAGGLNASRGTPDLARLTPQEQAVARLVASGASNQQTAIELFISVKTVQYHLTHIYGKLGIRSRSELAARFREIS